MPLRSMNELPQNPLSVTPAWLTHALTQNGFLKTAKISNITCQSVGGEEGFSGIIARFKLTYDKFEASAPQTLIGKFSFEDEEIRHSLRTEYENEVRFYAELNRLVQIKTPDCYYHQFDPDSGAFVLLLEDLTHWHLPDLIGGLSKKETKTVVKDLARFHASTWEHQTITQNHWLPTPRIFIAQPFANWWHSYPAVVAKILPDFELPHEFMQVGNRFFAQMDDVLDYLSQPPLCCIHSDVHADNLLFGDKKGKKGKRPLTVYDWSMVAKGRGVYDVTYLLISSLNPNLRRKLETKLLQKYHNILQKKGVTNYSFAQCWHDYKLSYVGKLLVTVLATTLFDNSSAQRRAWRQVDLERNIAFIQDHQVLDLL